ncbi:hypothetical protein AXG93_4510s1310 [Marchantia polymorpha subsp. ruderalis]|uniref:Uncharacterized protein n=1 Tax=Marchantia polymorpha subsp. ruderalis TaxID=1480154 RepID=A0A176WGD2_MARPO|nr:hypothetical protein AXG93_4510s1310 [Marchantia polymorpha subsp. ruderalis]
MITEEPSLALCQVSLGTVEFDKGEGSSACERKAAEMSLSDLLNERIVLLVKYLVPASSADPYVELVRIRTKAKTAATAGAIEQIKTLIVECAAATATLQEQEEQLWTKEFKLRMLETSKIVEHRQLGRLVSSFIFNLKETWENLELEFSTVLHRIGVVRCSAGVATVVPVAVASVGGSQHVDCASGCSL